MIEICLLVVVFFSLLFLSAKCFRIEPNIWLVIPVLLSLTIKFFYFYNTNVFVRQHDLNGHVQYIQYVLDNFTIPRFDLGWQTYQPPLYHFFCVIWFFLAKGLGLADHGLLPTVQSLSLLLSLLQLLPLIYLSSILFTKNSFGPASGLFLFLSDSFPGVVFQSAKINNDVLAVFLATLSFAVLMSWWIRPDKSKMFCLAFIISLGLLTKITVSVVLLTVCLTVIVRRNYSFRSKLGSLGVLLFVILIVYSWYPYRRVVMEGQKELVGNKMYNDPLLFSSNSNPSRLFWYNPIAVTFNSIPLNYRYHPRKDFVWELYILSSLTSEFGNTLPKDRSFDLSVQVILAAVNLCLLSGIYCLFVCFFYSSNKLLPCGILLLSTVLFQILIRANTNIPGLADFRYTSFVLPPALALLLASRKVPAWFAYFRTGICSIMSLAILYFFWAVCS